MEGRPERWLIADAVSAKVLDNANGYGYTTPKKALASWNYKHPKKQKTAEELDLEERAMEWIKHHKASLNYTRDWYTWHEKDDPTSTLEDFEDYVRKNNVDLQGIPIEKLFYFCNHADELFPRHKRKRKR